MRAIDLKPNPTGHAAPVTHVAFRADGRRLASCSYDGTVLVWDTGVPSRPVRIAKLRHRRLVNASAWNPAVPTLLATASADKTVGVWQIPDRARADLVGVLARHTDDVNSVGWMPDGRRLICVSEDGRATLWEALTGAYLGEVGTHAAHCMTVSVSRDGLVATVGEDGMVSVGAPDDPDSGGPLTRHYDASVEGCAWSHSGKTLAVARDDGAVDLLTPRLEPVRTVQVSDSAARAVSWADDDGSLVVGAYDGSLHFLGASGERLRRLDDVRQWPRSVSAARGLVAVGSFRSSPHLVDFRTGSRLVGPAGENHGPNALAVRGDELLIGCDSGRVFAVDTGGTDRAADETADGAGRGNGTSAGDGAGPPAVRTLAASGSPVLSLAVHDGGVFAGTYAGHVVRCGEDERTSEPLGAPVPSLCSSGDRLIAGTYNGELLALRPDLLTVAERAAPHGGSVKSLAALGGGFLSAATDRTVAGGPLHRRVTLWEHGNLVNSVATLDGQVAATASRDHTVKVVRLVPAGAAAWQVTRMQTLLGADESVKCVGLLGDADAPQVLAGSYDFGLRLWEVDWTDSAATLASGRVLAEFGQGVSCIVRLDSRRAAVAGWDGRILIVGRGGDGTVRVLRSLDVGDLAERAVPAREAVAG
ncbi:WD40 repeat domain-containing protein [Streptomyces nanshensis]|uniref:Repetative protein n=1 Tax=Streptomyces nanshensis TaxID=518642 RepID=A0A1E7L779_9ACTN|nr:WD40 repeat domain-containing protein [Streptomyces nanshensis]OEV12029.1 repetative protein [Streptomyces nanshensis]